MKSSLEELYDKYVFMNLQVSSSIGGNNGGKNSTSFTKPQVLTITDNYFMRKGSHFSNKIIIVSLFG